MYACNICVIHPSIVSITQIIKSFASQDYGMRVPASKSPITAVCAAKCCAPVKQVDSRTDNSADFH